ncbi:MAG: DUF3131 domain-containing protein, partial [Gillisia sp.]|nr:DUF3131 domain-containing protein [Gillisia sp.]
MFRSSYVLVLMILFFSCSDKGPGYEEPYVPEPKDNGTPEVILTDNEILDLVQKQTFRYFWDFAEPNSGMARERSQADAYDGNSRNIVTMGGSGFGIASFPAAVERGWVSHLEAVARLEKILDFLESVPRYHGAFSHWYNANSATTRPFG